MTKEECVQLVDAHRVSWNQDPADTPTYELWWRYFENRRYAKAMEALDWFVARGGFPPRVSDVYRRTIDLETGEAPLQPAEALSQANALVDANNRGVAAPEVHGFVMQTMLQLRKKRIPWSPKVFSEEYENTVTEHYFGAR